MENKMKVKKRLHLKSLSSKVSILNIVSVILTVIMTSAVALYSMNTMSREASQKDADSSIKVLESQLESQKKILSTAARTVALNSDVESGIVAKDKSSLIKNVTELSKAMNFQTATVTDASGIVIARIHDPEKFGDNVTSEHSIQLALKGETSSSIESSAASGYAVKAGAPVYDGGGKVIGAVSLGYRLDNPEFVDNLKKSTGEEATIFQGDTRINTTIMENGKRAVGTKLDPQIADIVIQQKKIYSGTARIFGINYITTYSPILSEDKSTVTGVLFSGNDMTGVERQMNLNVAIIFGISLFAILVAVLFGNRFLKKNLKRPLEKVVHAAEAIGAGQMDAGVMTELSSITTQDEIGTLAVSMQGAVTSVQRIAEDTGVLAKAIAGHDLTVTVDVERHSGMYRNIVEIVRNLFDTIGEILTELKNVSESIDLGSEHLAGASQTMAQGATEQASSIEELAATITEISEKIRVNAEHAEAARTLSKEAGEEVMVGSRHMEELIVAMDDINSKSSAIEKIIKTIDDIAFQTNILALNAAVEAARAGAAGRGFAVVADEVRNLATKSAAAAKETTGLIEGSLQAVEHGGKIAATTEDALRIVVEKTGRVNEFVKQIAEEMEAQSAGIGEVNIGVDQISSVVQTNSATAEETAASSEELSGQARSLQEMVAKYKLNERSQSATYASNDAWRPDDANYSKY